ncbi:MAG: diacylglycerol kinase [Bermanella sp.]
MSQLGGQKPFSLSARAASFGHALRGLLVLLREQHNARIHVGTTLLVLICGVLLELSRNEWIIVTLLIGWVLSMEAFNSALEYLCDLVSREEHPLITKAKDVAAAAVLLSALTAAVIAMLIFIPKLLVIAGF